MSVFFLRLFSKYFKDCRYLYVLREASESLELIQLTPVNANEHWRRIQMKGFNCRELSIQKLA